MIVFRDQKTDTIVSLRAEDIKSVEEYYYSYCEFCSKPDEYGESEDGEPCASCGETSYLAKPHTTVRMKSGNKWYYLDEFNVGCGDLRGQSDELLMLLVDAIEENRPLRLAATEEEKKEAREKYEREYPSVIDRILAEHAKEVRK